MDNEQHAWARAELDRVYPDASDPVRQAVTALLSVWTRVDVPFKDANKRSEAIAVFAHLANLEPLETQVEEDARIWAPAHQYVTTGARYARVRTDTVAADDRWKFNGRVGEVVSLRNGYMTIRFLEPLDGAPREHSGVVKNFEVDISHLVRNAQ